MGLMKWLGMDEGCKQEPVEITDANFREEVVSSDVPVMIDVWSPGCMPCVALADTVKRLACKYDGKLKVGHLNAQAFPRTSSRLRVSGTPTVLFFKNGAAKERVVGVRGQHYYEEIIEEELLDPPEAEQAAPVDEVQAQEQVEAAPQPPQPKPKPATKAANGKPSASVQRKRKLKKKNRKGR